MSYFEQTNIANVAGAQINPATEETSNAISNKLPTLVGGQLPIAGYDAATDATNVLTQNIITQVRDSFESYTPGVTWTQVKASGDLIYADGGSSVASYLVISKDPLVANTESSITTIGNMVFPVEVDLGVSMSQRTLGQEFSMELVDVNTTGPAAADLEIASLSQTTTTLTVNTTLAHGLSVGRCIGIYGCSNQLANYPSLVVATVPSPTQFTVTAGPGGTIVSQTITNPTGTKGFVYARERLGRAKNGISQIFENITVGQSSLYARSGSGDSYPSGTIAGNQSSTTGTTASIQLVNSLYQYAFGPTTEYHFLAQPDRVQWVDAAVDAVTQTTNRLLRTQVCPDPSAIYQFRFRAVNSKALTVPSAQIVSAVKTGTTTATITTDVAHGLTTGDLVTIYGIRDQAASSFPNIVTATAVTVTGTTTFTTVIGTASTVTSYGGLVAKVQGGNLPSALGYNPIVAQSAILSTLSDGTRQLTVTGSGTWAGLLIGDLINIVGMRNSTNGATLSVDGAWKVANVATTTLTLVLPYTGSMALPIDFGSTNCGGTVIKRTDMRISFVRIFDYSRERVELLPRPTADLSAATPVVLQGGTTAVTGTLTAVTTVTTVGSVTSSQTAIPGIIADVVSAALAATTTTTAFTPTFGASYEINIPVTAVGGTTPTMDVSVEESDDSGTNWYTVYQFPRITATGMYRSPTLQFKGNRVRYVQTLTGTTPSFTRAINRLQSSSIVPMYRQLVDNAVTINPNTLNSTTASIDTRDCGNQWQLIVRNGATMTGLVLQMEGSDDDGLSWYNIGTALTVTTSTTQSLVALDVSAGLARVRASTAGTGAPGSTFYIVLKARGY